jgi:hypothetical protein
MTAEIQNVLNQLEAKGIEPTYENVKSQAFENVKRVNNLISELEKNPELYSHFKKEMFRQFLTDVKFANN